jgi:hypothetical protein
MMADAEDILEFLEGGVGMFFDLSLEFLRIEFAPMPPAGFGGQRPRLHGVQIPINGAPTQFKTPGGLGFGAARLDEVHHPFPQVQCISFHARKLITLCINVNMKCYTHFGAFEECPRPVAFSVPQEQPRLSPQFRHL